MVTGNLAPFTSSPEWTRRPRKMDTSPSIIIYNIIYMYLRLYPYYCGKYTLNCDQF